MSIVEKMTGFPLWRLTSPVKLGTGLTLVLVSAGLGVHDLLLR